MCHFSFQVQTYLQRVEDYVTNVLKRNTNKCFQSKKKKSNKKLKRNVSSAPKRGNMRFLFFASQNVFLFGMRISNQKKGQVLKQFDVIQSNHVHLQPTLETKVFGARAIVVRLFQI